MLVKLCPSILTLLMIHQAEIKFAGILLDSWQNISIFLYFHLITNARSPCCRLSHTGHPFFTTNTPNWNLLCTCVTVVWYRYTMRVVMVTMRLLSCYSNTEPVSMWLICGSLLPYTKQPPRENMKSANFYWRYVDGKFIIAKCIDNQ